MEDTEDGLRCRIVSSFLGPNTNGPNYKTALQRQLVLLAAAQCVERNGPIYERNGPTHMTCIFKAHCTGHPHPQDTFVLASTKTQVSSPSTQCIGPDAAANYVCSVLASSSHAAFRHSDTSHVPASYQQAPRPIFVEMHPALQPQLLSASGAEGRRWGND
jgi:hypothetical protein